MIRSDCEKDGELGPGFGVGVAICALDSGFAVPDPRKAEMRGVWQLPHERCVDHVTFPPVLQPRVRLLARHQSSLVPGLSPGSERAK